MFKRLNSYARAYLVTVPVALLLLLYLVGVGAADLIFSDWFIHLVSIPAFFANQIVTAVHIGGIVDIVVKKPDRKAKRAELIGAVLGVLFGLVVGIGISAVGFAVPLASTLLVFANVLFVFRQVNVFSTLGILVGKVIDPGARPWSEKLLIASAISLGLALGIVLFATGVGATVSVPGIMLFFAGTASIPTWIAGAIFVLSVSSVLASAVDYGSKAFNYARSFVFVVENDVTEAMKPRTFEYRGSMLGVTLGLGVGITVASLLGPVGVVVSALVVVTCTAMLGGTFSHAGRFIDKWLEAYAKLREERAADAKVVNVKHISLLKSPGNKPKLAPQPQPKKSNITTLPCKTPAPRPSQGQAANKENQNSTSQKRQKR